MSDDLRAWPEYRTDMTLRDALAEMFVGAEVEDEWAPEYNADLMLSTPRGQALAATPPVAALLADAAVGRAVRRLPEHGYWTVTHSPNRNDPRWDYSVSTGHGMSYGPTIEAAIAAALGDDDD